jgi:hypothetical protein
MRHLRVLVASTILVAAGAPTSSAATTTATTTATTAGQRPSTRAVLVAKPATIDFKKKRVGTENYQRTTITNTSGSPVRLLVTGGLPDDFGFGLMPGETCPVLDAGDILAAGASCVAVVRFSPTEGFLGWQAVGSLEATASDPDTGALVAQLSIPVLGRAVR